jgi:hypothetical protein
MGGRKLKVRCWIASSPLAPRNDELVLSTYKNRHCERSEAIQKATHLYLRGI